MKKLRNIALIAVLGVLGINVGYSQYDYLHYSFYGPNLPSPQDSTYRMIENLISRILSRQSGAATAGGYYGSPKAPLDKTPVPASVIHTPYFEYGYHDIHSELPGASGGHIHSYSVGYDLAWESGLILGLSYEYGNLHYYDVPANGDSHTVSVYAAAPLAYEFNGLIIGGYTDGTITPPAAAPINGDAWFINPGISRSWTRGDFVYTTALSYLHTDSGVWDWGTLIPEVGVRYNVSDSVFVGASVSYNSVLHDNFVVPIDTDWWSYTLEAGWRLRSNWEVVLGFDHAFSHDVQEVFTGRIGVSYEY